MLKLSKRLLYEKTTVLKVITCFLRLKITFEFFDPDFFMVPIQNLIHG